MAVVAGFNNTSGNDLVHTEIINGTILAANEVPKIYNMVGWLIDASSQGSGPTMRLPKFDSIDVSAGVKTEADEAAWVSFTTSKATDITAGVVIVQSLLTAEHEQDGMVTVQKALERQLMAMAKRWDSDLLGLITSATNTSDSTGVALTLDLWEAARAAYLAQSPVVGAGGFHAYVTTPKAVGKFQSLLRQSGGGAIVQGAGLQMFTSQPMAEYVGEYQGLQIFQGNAPANDGDNTSSAFICAGNEGALAMGVWWGARPEVLPVPGRVGTQLVTSSRYGVTISNQENLREFIYLK